MDLSGLDRTARTRRAIRRQDRHLVMLLLDVSGRVERRREKELKTEREKDKTKEDENGENKRHGETKL